MTVPHASNQTLGVHCKRFAQNLPQPQVTTQSLQSSIRHMKTLYYTCFRAKIRMKSHLTHLKQALTNGAVLPAYTPQAAIHTQELVSFLRRKIHNLARLSYAYRSQCLRTILRSRLSLAAASSLDPSMPGQHTRPDPPSALSQAGDKMHARLFLTFPTFRILNCRDKW